MFHSKEHLIRGSDPSLWSIGLDFNDDNDSQKLSNRIWSLVNTKLFNVVIILLVLIESLVIICQLLIDSKWIQDPSWRALTNCTNLTSITNTSTYDSNNSSQISPTLLTAKNILTYTSLTIILLFFVETLLRIYSGKMKLFVQPFELFDSLLVNVLFVLNIVFFLHNSRDRNGGQKSILLIVSLRLWRVYKIIQTLIEESQQRLIQLLNICDKEKTQAEHKIDILILKVEDLEHEVAYLKEKLKKTDKDNSAYIQQLIEGKNKKTAKRTQSSHSSISTTSYCPCNKNSTKIKPQSHNQQKQQNFEPINYTLVNIEAEPTISENIDNHQTLDNAIDLDHFSEPTLSKNIDNHQTLDNTIDLDHFARNLAQSITIDVMSAVLRNDRNKTPSKNELVSKPREENWISSVSNKTNPSLHNHQNSVIKPSLSNGSHIYSGLYLISDESNHSQESRIASNDNSSIAAHHLNEDLEIERIKKVEFNCNDVDIPLSSL